MYVGGERRAKAVKVVSAGGRVGLRLVIRIRSDSFPLEPNDAWAGSEQSKVYWIACVMSCGEYMESDNSYTSFACKLCRQRLSLNKRNIAKSHNLQVSSK